MPVEPLEHVADFLTPTGVFRGARIGCDREAAGSMKASDGIRIQQGQGADYCDLTLKERLSGQHGGNLGTVKHIDEKGFNQVIHVVAEGDLVTSQAASLLEESGASESSAKETGVLGVYRAVRSRTEVGMNYRVGNTQRVYPVFHG